MEKFSTNEKLISVNQARKIMLRNAKPINNKIIILKPDTKIIVIQVDASSNVCPISG